MHDTATLRIPGWTIADRHAGRDTAPRSGLPAGTAVTLDAGDLAAATRSLLEGVPATAATALRMTPGGLELTASTNDHAFWETAVLPVDTTRMTIEATAALGSLADVSERIASQRSTVCIEVAGNGRVRVDGVDLPTADQRAQTPPRPQAKGAVSHRVDLPPSLPAGVPIRLPGLAVAVPDAVRSRFVRRGISMASLFEADGCWYLSGIAQGRPMYVLVGQVAVY